MVVGGAAPKPGPQPNAALYGKWWIPLIILAYPYAAWQVANVLAVRPRRKLLKQAGPSARVLNKSHPRLKAVLAEQARLLGLPEPEMYVLHDDAAYMYSMPGKGAGSIIITTDALLAGLDDDEMATMIAREMGHALCNHVRMAFVLEYMRHAPAIVRILLFPDHRPERHNEELARPHRVHGRPGGGSGDGTGGHREQKRW